MNVGIKKTLSSLLAALFLVLSPALSAYAASETSPLYTSRPNVAWNVSNRRTVVVHIFNTTPFNMELASSDFKDVWGNDGDHPQSGSTAMNPSAFSPSGIPHKIPAKSGASFVVSWLDTSLSNKSNNNDDVLADLNMAYTMKQVDSSPGFKPDICPNPLVGDITVHMDFQRIKEVQKSLKGDVFKLMVSGASFIVDSLEMVIEPNPLALAGYLLSAYEIGATAKEIAERDGASDQGYFSAFVVSKTNSITDNFPATYNTPDTSSKVEPPDKAAPYDGLYSQHGTSAGCPQAYIIPAVAIQREVDADNAKLSGHLPVVFVTLATAIDWTHAMQSKLQVSAQSSAAGYKITQHLQNEGRKGHAAFIKLARTMNHEQRDLFDGAYRSILQKKPLTHAQEAFLLHFVTALEKRAAVLPPFTMPATHGLPVRK